jgi:cell division septation protein DedD
MNKKQKFTLLGVAAIVIAMLLFPPFYSAHKSGTYNMGYRWLFNPPDNEYSVNIPMLLVQWGAVFIAGAILFWLFKDSRNFSSDNAQGSSEATTIKSKRQPYVKATAKLSKRLIGVRGWFFFLCIFLTILSPFLTLLYIYKIYSWSKIYSIFPELQMAILSNLIFTIGLMGFGIYAGVMLWTIHKKALYITKFYLWSNLVYSFVSPFLTSAIFGLKDRERALFINLGIDQAIMAACTFLIWFTYLSRSKRVKYTFQISSYYKYPPQKLSDRQSQSLRLKETVRTFSEILVGIRIGDFLQKCRAKLWDTLPRKILMVSILSLTILMAIFHYLHLPWPGIDSILSGEKRFPPAGGMSSGVTSPDTKVASVQNKIIVEKIEETPPFPPRKLDEQGPPTDLSAPTVLSGPPSTPPSQVPSAVAPKEIEEAKAEITKKPEKVEKISKELAPPKKREPPPRNGFYSIKIMALRNPQKVQEFMESQEKKGFDIHSRAVTVQGQGLYHQIFLGRFVSKNEAQHFLEENKILQSYPGSAIMKLTK